MLLAWSILDALARNWALVAIAVTILTLVVVSACVLMNYVRISLNIMRTTKPPLSRAPLDFDRILGEPVFFPALDGLPLQGMLLRAPVHVPRRGMIIFVHEFCADMYSWARYCRGLHEHGYDIFTFDFRGHGQSECEPDYTPRQWITDHDMNDMRGAAAYVEQWLLAHHYPVEYGLFGISRGACAAILLAADNPQARVIVSDGGFSTDSTVEYFMRRWAYIFARIRFMYENHPPVFWRFLRWAMFHFARREFKCRFPSVHKALRRMTPRAILFIHGEKDSYLPVEQSRRLYALAPQPKALWIAAGARHNQAVIVHRDRYHALTLNFYDRYLMPAGVAPVAEARPEVAPPMASQPAFADAESL
ncbi:MAG: alpha/beta fold hydrolase [Phycisphaerales bacterium]|nr:alpha/beta fold hydrolase [Phycisphaerales bacterium]